MSEEPKLLGKLFDMVKATDEGKSTCQPPWHQFCFMAPRCLCGEKEAGKPL